LLFTLVSFLGGVGHLGGSGNSLGHFHVGHADSGHLGGGGHHAGSTELGEGISFLNLSSVTVFITWFGGVGFCLRSYGTLGLWIVIILSIGGGMLGAYIVYLFLAKFLLKGQSKPLRESDTYMPGTAARVSSGIDAGETGEIIYVHLGTRRSCGAKSIDGSHLSRGTKVVILKYEKGIAYVKACPELKDSTEN
jgi:hypothetical protein